MMGEKRRNVTFNLDDPRGRAAYLRSKEINFNHFVIESLLRDAQKPTASGSGPTPLRNTTPRNDKA